MFHKRNKLLSFRINCVTLSFNVTFWPSVLSIGLSLNQRESDELNDWSCQLWACVYWIYEYLFWLSHKFFFKSLYMFSLLRHAHSRCPISFFPHNLQPNFPLKILVPVLLYENAVEFYLPPAVPLILDGQRMRPGWELMKKLMSAGPHVLNWC